MHRLSTGVTWVCWIAGVALALTSGANGQAPAARPPAAKVQAPAALAPGSAAPWSAPWLAAQGKRYLDDADFRRAAMVQSLRNPNNLYSKQRLAYYGLKTRGWDTLPVWNPSTRAFSAADVRRLRAGRALRTPRPTPLWNGRRPDSMAEWVALGRQVFFRYPLRDDAFVAHALRRPKRARSLGLRRARDGSYPGVVVFRDVEGRTEVGITCALCHTTPRAGDLVIGEARRDLDYGRIRLDYHAERGVPLASDLARRMAQWGPGRADITEDEAEDPVAIPDLWGLREQTHLTQAGTIRHIGPAALALRQETQLLHSNHQRVRPPRELAWALAVFLYSLEPPPRRPARTASAASVHRGRALFERRCSTCHSNPGGGGDLVSAKAIGTDPTLAFGVARGTGMYRPPTLVGGARAAPYLHHGAVASLKELFSTARFATTYRRGARGPGPVPGHAYGVRLPKRQRDDLIAYLRSL